MPKYKVISIPHSAKVTQQDSDILEKVSCCKVSIEFAKVGNCLAYMINKPIKALLAKFKKQSPIRTLTINFGIRYKVQTMPLGKRVNFIAHLLSPKWPTTI